MYDKTQLIFGNQTVEQWLQQVNDHNGIRDDFVDTNKVSESYLYEIERRLFNARKEYIHDNYPAHKKMDGYRILAEHTWPIAKDHDFDQLKQDVIGLLERSFGVTRAHKIIKRMDIIEGIHRANPASQYKESTSQSSKPTHLTAVK